MRTRWGTLGIVAGVLGGLALVGLAVYLLTVGLERADKVASVIAAFAGLLSLGVGIVELMRRSSARAARSEPTNLVSGIVTGDVVQAHTIDGGVHFGRAGEPDR
jgi:hypothetical protein